MDDLFAQCHDTFGIFDINIHVLYIKKKRNLGVIFGMLGCFISSRY